uniref:Rho/Rac guanine nucleotide exchange factor 2 n=1 Tax=Anas zonorhyncha TaxID=75864 RepID=A0A8B9UVR4_9AVES
LPSLFREAKTDARYTNGHLFTTITVSGMTMCFACNKSITAKEALICPTCNVTIHNRCKDTLPNCTKVKQKQQKAALLKNSSALQSVSLRNKTAIRERPNSAIYPSESFRQTLLGPRRGRPSLSLSKSVSTTNIAGTLNDESPLGIRRILSQSTDSLNMRNRTLSVESLIDEGPDVILNQLLSDFETDEKDFEADSWSLAVDNSFLQQHKMDVMKRQDVIYELIQTEIHHVRTLKIMGSVFRRAMLEELQLDPGTVQKIFPCVDELSQIHERFLAQLLERRRDSLAQDSNKNFVINRLGDILVGQFSGSSAEQMKKAYSEFCSRHTKAVKEYKDLLARDKRFQHFVRRMARSPLLRRHGVPECILLVTQRITKYPVLIERILKNSKDNEGDSADLSRALTLVKELISGVNEEVHACEMNARLWDVYRRVDGRAKAPLQWESRAGLFGRDELLRRKLVHSGCMLWKTAAGRFKDILVLLMTDVLIFLQEKDQKYTFPMLTASCSTTVRSRSPRPPWPRAPSSAPTPARACGGSACCRTPSAKVLFLGGGGHPNPAAHPPRELTASVRGETEARGGVPEGAHGVCPPSGEPEGDVGGHRARAGPEPPRRGRELPQPQREQ